MAYDGGPVDQSTVGGIGVFGGPSMFGMDNSGWNVATGGGNATSGGAISPWVWVAGAAVLGLFLWKSRR